ncbi:hypothetical protein [Nocardioides lijunqiniae]|uniref:hypothetical protein n=1 Tax=Nocardioides lijunqiniae TaxID=2760832 RepID=UPI001877ECDE|nr:hypothetical protein [Nocardioides lijunqiniae]
MESDPLDDVREAQRVADRAEAAPYIDFPPTPWWYPPAAGLWAGALVSMLALTERRSPISVVGIALLLLVQMAFVTWYTRYHGALPSPKGAPPEFRPAFARYTAGILVIMAAGALVWLLLNAWVAAATTAVLVTVGLTLYERAYADAAERTRARLG